MTDLFNKIKSNPLKTNGLYTAGFLSGIYLLKSTYDYITGRFYEYTENKETMNIINFEQEKNSDQRDALHYNRDPN